MGILRVSRRRLGIAAALLNFFIENKRLWIVPLITILLLFGVLIALAQSSVIAPFIYTLF
jgi:hypothetical protein